MVFTFGYSGAGASYTVTGTNDKIGCQYASTGDGTLTEISAYVYVDTTNNRYAAVYSDVANVPSALLDTSDAKSIVAESSGWVTFTGLNVAVTNGTMYWLAVNTATYLELYYNAESTYRSRVDSSDTPPPDDPFGSGTNYTDRRHRIYATCTEAAGGPTVKKGSSVSSTMTTMLNSKMLFSIANRFPKLSPKRFL